MSKTAIITGCTGQDGSYLSELLLDKGYRVYGIKRRASTVNTPRIDHLRGNDNFYLIYGDLADGIDDIIYDIQPDEIYNLASMSHVRVSFDIPKYTMDINAIGPTRILEAIRKFGLKNKTKFYQASSSEMFGLTPPPQNEDSPFIPCSPYGIAKLAAYWMTKTYRDGYGLFASNGILYNHESPRRGETFVTKKIVRAAVRISLGRQRKLVLGNIDARRDWGHSKDYCEAIWKILQHYEPDDFVVATGENYTIREFVIMVFQALNLNWEEYVVIDAVKYLRPKEVPALCGDSSKIKRFLKWEPKIKIEELITMMITSVMKEERNV